MPQWDSSQYLEYRKERTQPSVDLAVRVAETGFASEHDGVASRIVDIGCGPGNSTGVLATAFPGARIMGVDNSQDMLAFARTEQPQQEFKFFDASGDSLAYQAFASGNSKFDLVFSNACIQWIPGHAELLANMMGLLDEGGMLAIQVPLHQALPLYHLVYEVAASPRWAPRILQPDIFSTLLPEEYFGLLARLASDFTMWETTYYHMLPSHEAVLEWYRGSGLRPYVQAIRQSAADGSDGKGDAGAFESEVLEGIEKTYPAQANGEIMLCFPRLFFIAWK